MLLGLGGEGGCSQWVNNCDLRKVHTVLQRGVLKSFKAVFLSSYYFV